MKKPRTTQNNANVLWTMFYLIAILFCKSHDGDPPFSGCVRGIKHLEKNTINTLLNNIQCFWKNKKSMLTKAIFILSKTVKVVLSNITTI